MLIGAQLLGYSVNAGMFDALSVTPGLGLAFVRLRAAYTGKCINVRRDSDNATMDIGFRNGLLDTATLLAFNGSANGFVTTWYNQGSLGSAGNATQSTAASQPQIVSSGALITDGGKPAMLVSATQLLKITGLSAGTFNSSSGFFVNIVAHDTAAASGANAYVLTNRSSNGWYIRYQGASSYQVSFSTVGTGGGNAQPTVGSSLFNTQMILSLNYNGTQIAGRYNGNAATASASYNADAANVIYINTSGSGGGEAGYVSQVVGLNASISNADWATLELAEAALYGISGVTQ
jgi:hypothetical protein